MQCTICEKELFGHKPIPNLVCGSCVLVSTNEPGKTAFQVGEGAKELWSQETPSSEATKMKVVKVKSNSVRNRIVALGDVYLSFDEEGIAELPEHLVPALALYLRAKPGRYQILEEEKEAKSPVAKPAEEAPKKAAEVAVEAKGDEAKDDDKKSLMSSVKESINKRSNKKADKASSDK